MRATIITFLMALILTIIPLPDPLNWARPHFIPLMLIYWILNNQRNVGVITGWGMGILLDVLGGGLLGQYALSFSVVAFLCLTFRERFKTTFIWQQLLIVFILVFIGQLCLAWSQWLFGIVMNNHFYWTAPLTSVLFWPFIILPLRILNQSSHVKK